MNALISFRSNGAGNLSPTSAQRRAATEQLSANFQAQINGVLRDEIAKSGQTSADPAKAATSSSSTSGTSGTSTSTTTKSKDLDRDAFLQLLVKQMQNQDPLDPMDNSAMIAQLAQFSSLEQMNNLNTSFEGVKTSMSTLSGNIDQLNFISAQAMLGQQVQGVSEAGTLVTGNVDSVHLDGTNVLLSVGDALLPMAGVVSIGQPAAVGKKS